jgi:hypothetical protein
VNSLNIKKNLNLSTKELAMKKIPYSFPGITVIVPQQEKYTGDVVAIDKGIPNRDEIIHQQKEGVFHATRFIANIVLYEKRDDGRYDLSEPIKHFNPPIELRVGYEIFDIVEAGGKNQEALKLAYWNGVEWVLISDPAYDYMILPPNTGQIAEAKIDHWAGDPPIAWVR